jgi:hypothetical protein
VSETAENAERGVARPGQDEREPSGRDRSGDGRCKRAIQRQRGRGAVLEPARCGSLDPLDRDRRAQRGERFPRPAREVPPGPLGGGVSLVPEHVGNLDEGHVHAAARIRRER